MYNDEVHEFVYMLVFDMQNMVLKKLKKSKASENKVLRNIPDEVRGGQRKLPKKELHGMYFWLRINKIITQSQKPSRRT
jgi:hypothetical protein